MKHDEKTTSKAKRITGIGMSIVFTVYCFKIIGPFIGSFFQNANNLGEINSIEPNPVESNSISPMFIDTVRDSKNKNKGTLQYGIPDTMYINQRTRIGAIISTKKIINGINDEMNKIVKFPGQEKYTTNSAVVEIEISDNMMIKLSDSSSDNGMNFKIIALSSEEQIIDTSQSSGSTYWQWDVIPLRQGKLPLILSVNVILYDDYGKKIKSIPVFEKTVHVITSLTSEQKNMLLISYIIMFIFFLGLTIGVLIYRSMHRKSMSKFINNLEINGELSQIEILISKDETELALGLFKKAVQNKDKKLYSNLLLISAELKELKDNQILGIEEDKVLRAKKTAINNKVLSMLEKLRSYNLVNGA